MSNHTKQNKHTCDQHSEVVSQKKYARVATCQLDHVTKKEVIYLIHYHDLIEFGSGADFFYC